MLWAACCVAFFGFLLAGEFTCDSRESYSPRMLSPGDVHVDSRESPKVVSVQLHQTKTDPFRTGVTVFLGRTGHRICPVSALLAYLVLRGTTPGPLFQFQDGSTLSKGRLLFHLHQTLQARGVGPSGLTGHSFRIGAATAAAQSGLEDSFIQTLGRWTSDAFRRYIRTSGTDLAMASSALVFGQRRWSS